MAQEKGKGFLYGYFKRIRIIYQVSIRDLLVVKPIYFFNHIPKCGGTSFRNMLKNWFAVINDYRHVDTKKTSAAEIVAHRQSPVQLEALKPWHIVSGHFHVHGSRIVDRYPEIYSNPRIRLITFLREPLAHHISLYKYGLRYDYDYIKGLTFKQYLNTSTNFLAWCLCCDETNYKDTLEKYFFVGIVEEYDLSINCFAKKISRNERSLVHLNQSDTTADYLEQLSADEIGAFKINNKLDYLIYEYAVELLHKLDVQS